MEAADGGLVLAHGVAVRAVREDESDPIRSAALEGRREAERGEDVLHRVVAPGGATLGRQFAADVAAGALDGGEVAPRAGGAGEPAAEFAVGLRRAARGPGVGRDRPEV